MYVNDFHSELIRLIYGIDILSPVVCGCLNQW